MKLTKRVLDKIMTRDREIVRWLTVHKSDAEGALEIMERNSIFRYYLRSKDPSTGKRIRRYLSESHLDVAKRLASQEYYATLYQKLCDRLDCLQNLHDNYTDEILEEVYESLHQGRKALVPPVIESRKRREAHWQEDAYEGKPLGKDVHVIQTKRGDQVRSKSEKILADMFYDMDVPYRYECPLELSNGLRIYPDFTLLDPEDGGPLYWEHFGRMEDPEYARKAVERINLYAANGYYLGDRLMATFESSNVLPDYTALRAMVKKRFL